MFLILGVSVDHITDQGGLGVQTCQIHHRNWGVFFFLENSSFFLPFFTVSGKKTQKNPEKIQDTKTGDSFWNGTRNVPRQHTAHTRPTFLSNPRDTTATKRHTSHLDTFARSLYLSSCLWMCVPQLYGRAWCVPQQQSWHKNGRLL